MLRAGEPPRQFPQSGDSQKQGEVNTLKLRCRDSYWWLSQAT